MTASDVRIAADLDALSLSAAEAAATVIEAAVRRAGRCAIALSGGHTPRTLHEQLATRFRDRVPWTHVHVYWGDERYVPPDDPRSNYRMAKETLLDRVPCPAANIHPMPTHLPPERAASAYEATLRSAFDGAWPRFDLVFLGLGPEGHTASLFPRSPALEERVRWSVAVEVPAEPPQRLTLTLPVLARAAHVFFLVAGLDKADVLRRVLNDPPDLAACPASALRHAEGDVVWWCDARAAAHLGT
ncbi:MAG TPA: 6-phosphogluconolactonase [Vicinamibacterales bacterium]|nr:6-phosphogluconolactonase [Vicinamibacterales bacterium]